MARKTLTIEYDPTQDRYPLEPGEAHENFDLFAYLQNEFDNKWIVAVMHEEDTPATTPEQRLEALQDAIARFEDNFKHAILTPLSYPEPPEWLKPLVRDLHAALEASKVQ